jgi:outer membrane receptor protein involved in Fe transport
MIGRAALCAWWLLALADGLGLSPASAAPAIRYRFDIPASPAEAALSAVSEAANVSIGWSGTIPALRTAGVRGVMSTADALRKMLAGSGYRAVAVSPIAFRIEPTRRVLTPPSTKARPPVPAAAPTAITAAPEADLVVTGQKRLQLLRTVAMSISRVDLAEIETGKVAFASRDLSFAVEGLSLTNLGPGRNRQFIRGVADSPFNGTSQTTVAIQLDEARVTFDAPDPDLRLIDMDRVEILKGPQGPLYGSGALGGIYHMVTRKPDLNDTSGTIRVTSEAIQHGGLGAGTEGVINLPIVSDTLAVRAVGYIAREGGWIDDVGGRSNANSTKSGGGRIAARWRIDPDWTLDVSGILQDVATKDSQYVTASDDTVKRETRIREPADNDFKSAAATLEGPVAGLTLLATGSYVDHQVRYTLDSSDASAAFGIAGNSKFVDARSYRIANGEIRLSPAESSHWLAGVSFLRATSHDDGTIEGTTQSVAAQSLDRRVTEVAAFGEVTLPLPHRINATAGARLFYSSADDEAVERESGTKDSFSRVFVSPSLALSWSPDDHNLVFLRYARALRPGGLAAAGEAATRRFDSDELGSFDLGFRSKPFGGDVALSGSLFYTIWNHIQSDYLLDDGLVATRNAGKGRIRGIEASADWWPAPRWQVSVGGTFLNAELVKTEDGSKLDDRRLPVTPDMTGRFEIRYHFQIGPWVTRLSGQANYVGRSRLSFDESLDRKMGNYATVATSASFTHDKWTLSGRIDNLLDIEGDTFAFGNPFSIASGQQYTPLRPRTFTLSLARSW